jgi:hypothetical protein
MALLVPIATIAGCAAGAPPSAVPIMDGSGTAPLGGHARFSGLDVVPLRVQEDSRCPASVQCIQAGTVRLAVEIDDGEVRSETQLTLGASIALADGRRLSLAAVCPYPRQPGPIASGSYRFTFAVGLYAPPPPGSGCPA